MHRITLECWQHINAGETVGNGFAVDGYCTAPQEPGMYTLYELVLDGNIHAGWEWEKEDS